MHGSGEQYQDEEGDDKGEPDSYHRESRKRVGSTVHSVHSQVLTGTSKNKTETSIAHDRHRMDKPQPPILNPELMRVWDTRRSTKVQEHIDSADSLVDNISPVDQRHAAGYADVAAVVGRAVPGIDAPFQPVAGRTPGYDNALVVEEVEVGISRRLDNCPRVAPLLGDGGPVFLGRVVIGACRIEQPIPLVRDDSLDLGDLRCICVVLHLNANNVRVGAVGDDDFGVRRALGGVVQAAVVVDLERLAENAALDGGGFEVLSVGRGRGDGREGASALRCHIVAGGGLESCIVAGCKNGGQADCQGDEDGFEHVQDGVELRPMWSFS